MIHPFPKCPAVCTANKLCAYVPYSLLALPCTQCVSIEDADEDLKDFIKPSTGDIDLSRKVSIFLIWITDSLLNIVSFECKSCSGTHLFATFQGCDQNKSSKTTPEDPEALVRSATPTGSKEGSSEIPDTSPLEKLASYLSNLSVSNFSKLYLAADC
jgi:hypothetical protein